MLLLLLISRATALYFFLSGNTPRCFLEELPKESTVVGTYDALEWSDSLNAYQINPSSGIQITVEHVASRQRLASQKGDNSGKFAFTSHESGDHSICLSSNSTNWFSGSRTKLTLDLMFGDSSHPARQGGLDAGTKKALDDLTVRIRQVNDKVQAVRREQIYQREREREFRDTSERTNSRVVNWSLIQLLVIGGTAAWQVTQLKKFFVSKKLV